MKVQVLVKPDRVKKLRNFYPWVYADEIAEIKGEAQAGELVEVRDTRGDWIGCAFFNPRSHIAARLLSYDSSVRINRAFFQERIAKAAAERAGVIFKTNAWRVAHAEADGLPGLVVDRFADVLVVQFRNPGIDRFRDDILRALKHVESPRGIFERSDMQAREEEGLEPRVGLLWGEAPEQLVVVEDDVEFIINPQAGQKTGFYLDQRDNRRLLREMVVPGDRVLDVFSYTGGFSLHAAHKGARTLAVDKDQEALQLLELNAKRNALAERIGARWGDAEKVMEQLAAERRTFTHVILDPPTLAKHKNEVPLAKQLFVRLTLDALRLLDTNGVLFLSTCAYHIGVPDLIEVTRIAAGDLSRRVRVITVTYQPADHPWMLQIPETLYLKTLVVRVE